LEENNTLKATLKEKDEKLFLIENGNFFHLSCKFLPHKIIKLTIKTIFVCIDFEVTTLTLKNGQKN